ncbi:MAG TPA: hypothetical protein V6C89_13040 [Drouetiella sp.]|jgi:hypothetical protein
MLSEVHRISIAAPCSVKWDAMTGDEQTRFCNQCDKHVYNISSMSESEVEQLFVTAAAVPCIKLFRRLDGTIIFDNCPVGLRKLRDQIRTTAKFLNATVATIVACVAASVAAFAKDECKPVASGVRIDWTLSENGHTEPTFDKPEPVKQLAQLGIPDTNVFNLIRRSMPPVYGLSVNNAFGKALKLADSGKMTLAEIEFQKALGEAERSERDPNVTEFIATEYAKLLRKKGDAKGADALIAKYKVAGVASVTKVSK